MTTPLIDVIVLGILQGLTEFLPVSSSGHLALAQVLFGIKEQNLTLSVVLHAGTLLATLLYFRKRVGLILGQTLVGLRRPSRMFHTEGGRDALVVLLSSLPTAIIGLALHDTVERWTAMPLAVGAGFVITSLLLVSTRFADPGAQTTPTWKGALLIGLAQGLAVVPGISRSGSTIAAALWLGVRSERAFELSMLISLPAVFGAFLLELRKALGVGDGIFGLLIGAGVAFAVGLVALAMLRHVVTRGRLVWFVLWVGPLALATLALAWAWPQAV